MYKNANPQGGAGPQAGPQGPQGPQGGPSNAGASDADYEVVN